LKKRKKKKGEVRSVLRTFKEEEGKKKGEEKTQR